MSVIWQIECDALYRRMLVKADSHHQMVEALLERGWKRILRDDVPYCDEPMVFEHSDGNLWDAMPRTIRHVKSIPEACNLPLGLGNEGLKESPSSEMQNNEAKRSFQKLCLRLQLAGTTEVIRSNHEDNLHGNLPLG